MARSLRINRRSALKLLGTGLSSFTAGCYVGNDETPPEATDVTTKNNETLLPNVTAKADDSRTVTDVDISATPNYLDWVFTTELMENSLPLLPYRVNFAAYHKHWDRLNSNTHRVVSALTEFPMGNLPLTFSQVSEVIGTRNVYVVKGDFSQRKIDEERPSQFERKPPEYQGFLIYLDGGDNQVLAGSDNLAIAIDAVPDSMEPRTVMKSVIDTGRGDYPRLLAERPHIGPLASWLGVHDITQINTHKPSTDQKSMGKMGHGIGWSFTEEVVNTRAVMQFQEASQATEESINLILSEELPTTDNWMNQSFKQNGPIVILDGEVTYEKLFKSNN